METMSLNHTVIIYINVFSGIILIRELSSRKTLKVLSNKKERDTAPASVNAVIQRAWCHKKTGINCLKNEILPDRSETNPHTATRDVVYIPISLGPRDR